MSCSVRFHLVTATSLVVVVLALASAGTAATPVPRLAYSTPQREDRAAARRDAADAIVIVHAGTVVPGRPSVVNPDARSWIADPAAIVGETYLHVTLEGRRAGTDAELPARPGADLLATLPLTAPAVRGVVLEVLAGEGDADQALIQFTLASLALQVRATREDLRVLMIFPAGFSTALAEAAARAGLYADGIGSRAGAGWVRDLDWAAKTLHKPVFLRLDAAEPRDARAASSAYLDVLLGAGTVDLDLLWAAGYDAASIAAIARTRAFLAGALPAEFADAGASPPPVALTVPPGGTVTLRTFVSGRSPHVAMLARSDAAAGVGIVAAGGEAFDLACYDAVDGRPLAAERPRPMPGGMTGGCAAGSGYLFVSVQRQGVDPRAYEVVDVAGRVTLRVEEVVARWQQSREAQQRALDNAEAACFLSLHFESTTLGSGFDVSLDLRQFTDRSGARDWVQTGFYVNGVRLKGRREFPLPQLEPEKVMTQPLELRLDEKYRYELLGTDTVGGRLSFVVGIEPAMADANLFRGKVWIDGLTFRQVRMQLEQRGGRSNVVSHVETQEFAPVADAAGREFNLFSTIYVQQILNAAGRSFLLEKRYRFSGYSLNNPAFEARLAEARLSDEPMFRDTDDGLRSLRREGGTRVVEPLEQRRIRSLVMGAFYEGTYAFPIPLAGLSLVDFDFRNTGAQLSVFFAGPIVAANLSRQQSSKLRVGFDAALSALPQNNRIYDGDTERAADRLWVFEEVLGALVSWQPTSDWSLTASSHFTANAFRASGDTGVAARFPGTGFTVQGSGEAKYARHGYTLTGMLIQARRIGWGDFADAAGEAVATPRSYLKYSAEFGKQFYTGRFTKAAVIASYYGGTDLDRFSRYRPSFLSRPRIRGIPSGTDAFDGIGIVGASYGFNVMDLVKFEGIYNHAWARNRDESARFRGFDGLELDIGTASPWGTFLQGTITYALRGNTGRYSSRWGVYLLLFKPLRR